MALSRRYYAPTGSLWHATAPPLETGSCVWPAYRSHGEGAAARWKVERPKYYNREQPYSRGAGFPTPCARQDRYPHISPKSACAMPISGSPSRPHSVGQGDPMSSYANIVLRAMRVSRRGLLRGAQSPEAGPRGTTRTTRSRKQIPARSCRIAYYTLFPSSSARARLAGSQEHRGAPSLPLIRFPWIFKNSRYERPGSRREEHNQIFPHLIEQEVSEKVLHFGASLLFHRGATYRHGSPNKIPF